MTSDSLETHLQVKRYGDFTLTDAVRPSLEVPIRPREGYRMEVFRDRASHDGWRDHPEHRAAQRRGIADYYQEYSIQVGTTDHASAMTARPDARA